MNEKNVQDIFVIVLYFIDFFHKNGITMNKVVNF